MTISSFSKLVLPQNIITVNNYKKLTERDVDGCLKQVVHFFENQILKLLKTRGVALLFKRFRSKSKFERLIDTCFLEIACRW